MRSRRARHCQQISCDMNRPRLELNSNSTCPWFDAAKIGLTYGDLRDILTSGLHGIGNTFLQRNLLSPEIST